MTQRYHVNSEEIIDPIQLLRTINQKTDQTKIKEQIIAEITQNKSQYSFRTAEEYNESTDRAFDKILEEVYGNTEQQIKEAREDMQKRLAEIEKTTAEKITDEATIRAATEREKTVVAISKKKAAESVHLFRNINDYGWIIYILAGAVVVFGLAVWAWEIPPMYAWIISLLPEKVKTSFEKFLEVWGIFTVIMGLLSVGEKGLFSYLASENRERKLYERYYRENSNALK